jgi:stress response protein YsnF
MNGEDQVGDSKEKVMTYEKIVTLYDTEQHAEAARRNLEAAGFSPGDISIINGKTLNMAGDALNEPGLWRRLFGRDIQPYEAIVYGRAVHNGGSVLTVRVPENDVARATNILNAHEAVDLRKRAVQEGLISGAAIPASTVTQQPASMAAGKVLPNEEILRLAEEQLDVGKRVIHEGTTRIRRFVTETPVEANVTLHEEHARVIRQASTDPNFIRDVDWTDKTIEVAETIEEPVISKSVHITEEVLIRKEATDTVRTVRDKIRRQQVEVEKGPGYPAATKKA